MVEVRITRVSFDCKGYRYEVCFVLGLLNTVTIPTMFHTLKDARAFVMQKLEGKSVPIICQ